jgi:hypothetical protein
MVGTSYDCLMLLSLLQLQGLCLEAHMEEAVIVGFVLASGFHMIPQLTAGYVIAGSQGLYEQLVGKQQANAAERYWYRLALNSLELANTSAAEWHSWTIGLEIIETNCTLGWKLLVKHL